jgi:hypothetical protein
MAKLAKKYPPTDVKPYTEAYKCLGYLVKNEDKHIDQMEDICYTLEEIKETSSQIREVLEEIKPLEIE